MLIVLILMIGMVCLLGIGLLIASQGKRSHIRRTGTHVMAKVTQVRSWQDPLQMQMMPFLVLGGRWRYELRAEWTDPNTQDTYVFTSGVKKGLPQYQRGDSLPAYMSPYGNYLELSWHLLR
jgi:hypothetical protein